MSISASSIAIMPKEHPSATGAQGCLSDCLRPAAAAGVKRNEYHQGSSNYLLRLIAALIKSPMTGT